MSSALKPASTTQGPQNPQVSTPINKQMHPQGHPSTFGQPPSHAPQNLVSNLPTAGHPPHHLNAHPSNPNASQHFAATSSHQNHSSLTQSQPSYSPPKNHTLPNPYQSNSVHPPPQPAQTQPQQNASIPVEQPEKPQSDGTPEPNKPEPQNHLDASPKEKPLQPTNVSEKMPAEKPAPAAVPVAASEPKEKAPAEPQGSKDEATSSKSEIPKEDATITPQKEQTKEAPAKETPAPKSAVPSPEKKPEVAAPAPAEPSNKNTVPIKDDAGGEKESKVEVAEKEEQPEDKDASGPEATSSKAEIPKEDAIIPPQREQAKEAPAKETPAPKSAVPSPEKKPQVATPAPAEPSNKNTVPIKDDAGGEKESKVEVAEKEEQPEDKAASGPEASATPAKEQADQLGENGELEAAPPSTNTNDAKAEFFAQMVESYNNKFLPERNAENAQMVEAKTATPSTSHSITEEHPDGLPAGPSKSSKDKSKFETLDENGDEIKAPSNPESGTTPRKKATEPKTPKSQEREKPSTSAATPTDESPLPELETITAITKSNTTLNSMNTDEKFITFFKNDFLAVRNAENSFYICQAVQNIYKSSSNIKIRWLSQDKSDKTNEIYIPDFYDTIDFNGILTNLNLERVNKLKFKLPPLEKVRIDNILRSTITEKKGEAEPSSFTEEHSDGLDESLYEEESQLKKKKKAQKRKCGVPLDAAGPSKSSKVRKTISKTPRKPAKKPAPVATSDWTVVETEKATPLPTSC